MAIEAQSNQRNVFEIFLLAAECQDRIDTSVGGPFPGVDIPFQLMRRVAK